METVPHGSSKPLGSRTASELPLLNTFVFTGKMYLRKRIYCQVGSRRRAARRVSGGGDFRRTVSGSAGWWVILSTACRRCHRRQCMGGTPYLCRWGISSVHGLLCPCSSYKRLRMCLNLDRSGKRRRQQARLTSGLRPIQSTGGDGGFF